MANSIEHPVVTSFLVAVAVRLGAVIVSTLFVEGVLIPDETQYLLLAQAAADGYLNVDFWPGYGLELFDATATFMWPLTALFWLFGPSRFVGQLLALLFGAATAAATASLAGRLLRRPYALLAGLMVALFPSQVLWSSVVLRESLIWAGLAAIAVIVGVSQRQGSTIGVIWSSIAVAVVFSGLVFLRIQTAALALWCVVPALCLGSGRRSLRLACAACVLLIAPWAVGLGPGGTTFARESLTRLGTSHAFMAMEADSSFLGQQESIPYEECAALPNVTPHEGEAGRIRGSGGLTEVAGHMLDRPAGDWVCIHDYSYGGSVLVDNRILTSVRRIPSGLFHTMVRPFPWESKSKSSLLAAGLESPLWLVIYGLAGFGVWNQRHRFRQLVFPVLIILTVSTSGAVVHGNLGTAFRHRGQILFSLVLLAVSGVQGLVDRRVDKQADRIDRP